LPLALASGIVTLSMRSTTTVRVSIKRKGKKRPILSSEERIREAAKHLFAERGYDRTSTAEICRLARTSESQIVNHFGDKQGLLDAVFEHAWEQINPTVRLATEAIDDPGQKLRILTEIVMNILAKDRELGSVFLLEGRRMRGDGHAIVLVPGYLEFIGLLDEILGQLAQKDGLHEDIKPAALRSGLIGAFEGLLRDQLLSHTSEFPAGYDDNDVRTVFYRFLYSCIRPEK
jgi:AcrR family transcriptional regulator